MNPAVISLISFASIFGAALLGTLCYRRVEQELSADVKDSLKQVLGLIGMMGSLTLGLLVASAYGSFTTRNDAIERMSADIVQLDRVLAVYGAEAQGVRRSLRDMLEYSIERAWPAEGSGRIQLKTGKVLSAIEDVQRSLYALSPKNEMQKRLQSRGLTLFDDLLQTRALALESISRPLPNPFLVVLVMWLSMVFFGNHLFVAPGRIVIAGIFVGALCLSTAIFMILELNSPLEGLMRISSAPLRSALSILGQ